MLYAYDNSYFVIGVIGSYEPFAIKRTGEVGIGTTNPTAKLHIGGTPGTDGIKFPDGTLQTTAASAGTGITLSTPIATNLGSETNIRDDNFGTRSSNQSTYSVNNQTFYATYDLGSEKTVMATAEIYGISAYDGGGDFGYANCSIQGSHNNSSWYTFGPSSGNVGVGGIACVGAVLSCRYIKVALFIHASSSSGIGQFTAGINEFKVR